MSIKCRVEVGAELLDQINPEWFKNIALETLSLANGQSCILGQLYEGYSEGCDELEINDVKAAAFGFHILFDPDSDNEEKHYDKDWNNLTKLWKTEIRNRRSKKVGKARTHR